MDETGPLPTFLIIGAQKSATRWLRANLGAHPDIFVAPSEISYFSSPRRYRDLGLAWYRTQFEGWRGEPMVGESTPGYMMWRHDPAAVAERIDHTLPDVRLLAILRDPVERAYSAMVHHIARERLAPTSDLVQLAAAADPAQDRLGLVAGGWYAASLRPFRDRFGDRLLVLIHDDLATDAEAVYRAAVAHVGAEPGFRPPTLEKVVHSAGAATTGLSVSARRALFEYYRDDAAELEAMLGRDLSNWRP